MSWVFKQYSNQQTLQLVKKFPASMEPESPSPYPQVPATQPHTTQTINERTSAGSDLLTAQSKACAPPDDGRIGTPKHAGATSPKSF